MGPRMPAEEFGIFPGSHLRASGRKNMRPYLCFYQVTQSALWRMGFRGPRWNQGDKWGDCLEISACGNYVLNQGCGNGEGEKCNSKSWLLMTEEGK